MDSTDNSTTLGPLTDPWSSTPTQESMITTFVYISPVVIQLVYYVIGITGIVGNCIVIFVMFRTPALHDVPNYLITNQSTVDLIASFIFLLNYAIFVSPDPSNLSESRFLAQMNCKFWRSNYLCWACVRVSAANLMCLTAERYFAVCHALAYRKKVRKHHVVMVAIFVWVLGFVYQSPVFFYNNVYDDGVCRSIWSSLSAQFIWGMSVWFSQLLIPVAFMTVVYVRIWKVLRNHIQPMAPGGEHISRRTTTARKNVIKTLTIVTVVYVVCWAPILSWYALFLLGYRVNFAGVPRFIFLAMGFSNLAVNPFIYAFKYRQFQKAVLALLGCKRSSEVSTVSSGRQSHPRNTNMTISTVGGTLSYGPT